MHTSVMCGHVFVLESCLFRVLSVLNSLVLLTEPLKNITAPVGCLLVVFTILKGNNFKLMTKNIKLSHTHTLYTLSLRNIETVKHVSHVTMLVTPIRKVVGDSWSVPVCSNGSDCADILCKRI
jgi:hypothetical protein